MACTPYLDHSGDHSLLLSWLYFIQPCTRPGHRYRHAYDDDHRYPTHWHPYFNALDRNRDGDYNLHIHVHADHDVDRHDYLYAVPTQYQHVYVQPHLHVYAHVHPKPDVHTNADPF